MFVINTIMIQCTIHVMRAWLPFRLQMYRNAQLDSIFLLLLPLYRYRFSAAVVMFVSVQPFQQNNSIFLERFFQLLP